MKIVRLTAENIKRLRAVEITPDGNTVVISGRNGQGKTSVLDAIWFALGGGPATRDTTKPIRDGEDHASVTLDLGEIRVSRTWVGEKTTLRVESADGARYSSPQQMLDQLVGRLSFDPLAFAHLPDREQLAALLSVVDLPIDPADLDRQRRALYEDRTAVGREAKQLEGQLAGMHVPADVPAEEISTAEIVAAHREAERVRQTWDDASALVSLWTQRLDQAQTSLAQARTALAELDPPDSLPAAGTLEEQLAEIELTNRQVRQAIVQRETAARHSARVAAYDEMTAQIADIDEQKELVLRNARMPVEGLAFDETGVTYRGVPFKQCSGAEQLRVSLAMAMAMNPTIRVIRITDGSLLDSDNLALIEEMAADRDFQVWIERVDETGSVGIHIEDGEVVERDASARRAS